VNSGAGANLACEEGKDGDDGGGKNAFVTLTRASYLFNFGALGGGLRRSGRSKRSFERWSLYYVLLGVRGNGEKGELQ